MRRAALVGVVALVVGCGSDSGGVKPSQEDKALVVGKPKPLVEYDAVKDRSSIDSTIRRYQIDGRADALLSLHLSGSGGRPEQWRTKISVSVFQPRKVPNVVSEEPVLTLCPGNFARTFKTHRFEVPSDSSTLHTNLLFDVTFDDVISLLDCSGRLVFDGKPIDLTEDEQETIRRAIVAAREATNAGR